MAEYSELLLYLPSSVKPTVLEENKNNKYITTLSAPIRLSKGTNYEAAVVKVSYPRSAFNVYDGHFLYYSFVEKALKATRIPHGMYRTPSSLINTFNEKLGDDAASYKISFDDKSQKFVLYIDYEIEDPTLKISENLAIITKFPMSITQRGYTIGVEPWDMTAGLSIVYCYCDIIQKVHIGDTLAPIFMLSNYSFNRKSGGHQILYEPKNPIYVPVSSEIINTVTVEFRTQLGAYFPFTTGETMILVHIRPSLHRV
jgi:hypothetical protein